MIKMIFSDMDGTLLDENGRMPGEFADVMERLLARGVRFAPASGRHYTSLIKSFASYEDRFLFLSDNGTMVRERGHEIYSNAMDKPRALEILAVTENIPEICEVYCGKERAYLLKSKHPEQFISEVSKYFGEYEYVDSFADVAEDVIKVSFFLPSGESEAVTYPLFAKYADDYQVVLASLYWVDIMNLDANKGAAVREVQRRLGLAPEECAAFGDYMNDREMMQAVYHSYAMENAYPAIKEIARFTAPSNAEHGVLKTIERFMAEGQC